MRQLGEAFYCRLGCSGGLGQTGLYGARVRSTGRLREGELPLQTLHFLLGEAHAGKLAFHVIGEFVKAVLGAVNSDGTSLCF